MKVTYIYTSQVSRNNLLTQRGRPRRPDGSSSSWELRRSLPEWRSPLEVFSLRRHVGSTFFCATSWSPSLGRTFLQKPRPDQNALRSMDHSGNLSTLLPVGSTPTCVWKQLEKKYKKMHSQPNSWSVLRNVVNGHFRYRVHKFDLSIQSWTCKLSKLWIDQLGQACNKAWIHGMGELSSLCVQKLWNLAI